ncbi:MAG: peptidylprolyl isomerase [Candidatus Sulfotelmatobacter sp.]
MHKSWLLCVLLGTLAWGQAQPGTAPAQAPPGQGMGEASKAPAPQPEVGENEVVLTIKGVCPAAEAKTAAKTTTASKTGASKASAAAKKPANCETKMTRKQFEEIAKGLSPNVTPQLKRQLETALPRFMAMSEAAKEQGLENSEQYKQTLKIAKMQILTNTLQRQVQENADKVPQADVEKYYKDNPEAYQQFSLDRIFVPRNKQPAAEDKDEAKEQEKLTEEQQKAKEAEDKAKQEKGEQELNKLADDLRARAAAGEDFTKLQKEAFDAAGTKVENPTVNLPKVRRTGLPAAQASVFELKTGEVSQVISDNGGHYIYKVVSVDVLPLDQVETEIHNKLKSERQKEMMDKYTNSFQAVPNEAYFGPASAGPVPPRTRGMRQPMAPPQGAPQSGASQQSAPPSANAGPQAPTPPAPPTKPN